MKNNKGFTLVELVAVVAIMLALATIATVAVTGVLRKNKNDVKKINEEQVLRAARLYVTEDIGNNSDTVKCNQKNIIKNDSLNKYIDGSAKIASSECAMVVLDANCNITDIKYQNSGC